MLINPLIATVVINNYETAIGDLEQTPPGIELSIDPLLQRSPNQGGFAPFVHLPGTETGDVHLPKTAPALEATPLSPEQKRELASTLLMKRLAADPQ